MAEIPTTLTEKQRKELRWLRRKWIMKAYFLGFIGWIAGLIVGSLFAFVAPFYFSYFFTKKCFRLFCYPWELKTELRAVSENENP